MEQQKQNVSLPDNAYRELKAGEEYKPLMSANSTPAEVTPYSVTMGIVMAIIFSAAAAFLGLKVGQVFEAAIPIAIIAVGMGTALGKKNMLGQNVIIQSIGASSGVIVAGAIFTLPALYILGLEAEFYQVFLSSLLGGVLGIVLLIPFRKYFVKEMHGKYPFPEATATTEVLVSGEKGGNQAKLLAVAGLVGPVADPVDIWANVKHFKREEFRCKCGGKYCDGFPAGMDPLLLALADRVREHFGAAAIVSSGLRCEQHNKNVGGATGSRHKRGKAMDFRIKGQNSSAVLEFVKEQPEVRYAYAIDGSYVHMDVL